MVKHLCEICGKDFPEEEFSDALERAREHEKIPVDEGDYHGVIVKDETPMPHYRLLIKSDKVSEKHERMYDSFSVYSGLRRFNREKPFKSAEGYEKELIERLIKNGGWRGLGEKEMDELKDMLDDSYPERKYGGKKVEKFSTI